MATTQTLEEGYWFGRKETRSDGHGAVRVTRRYLVPRVEYGNLAPVSGTDTAYDDTALTVVSVDRGGIVSAVVEYMDVTYEKPTAGGSPV